MDFKEYILNKYKISPIHFQAYLVIDAMSDFATLIQRENKLILKGAMNLMVNFGYKRVGQLTKDIDFSMDKPSQKVILDKASSKDYQYKFTGVKEINTANEGYEGFKFEMAFEVKNEDLKGEFSIDIAHEPLIAEIKDSYYSIEMTLADKFLSMVYWGARNTREKDFIDLKALFDSCDKEELKSWILKFKDVKHPNSDFKKSLISWENTFENISFVKKYDLSLIIGIVNKYLKP